MEHSNKAGFSLIEMMIASLLGLILTGAAVSVLQRSLTIANMAEQMGEVHQNARVAANLIAQDISIAGTGIPLGGIQLPSGNHATRARFGCDWTNCYVSPNTYDDDRLYSVTPGNGRGPEVDGNATDILTIMYRDSETQFDEYPLTHLTPSGNQITFDSRTDPPITDSQRGLENGDIVIVSNANGSAVGVVTGVNGLKALFADSDPLAFNQPSASFGNIASLANPGNPAGQYPPTRAFRVNVVTYYLDPSPDGLTTRLMRQVNATTPVAVAESIQDLQFTFDLFDEAAGAATADLDNAGGTPNQIRKVNIRLLARSLRPEIITRRFEHTAITTAVSTRNLAFRDRYE